MEKTRRDERKSDLEKVVLLARNRDDSGIIYLLMEHAGEHVRGATSTEPPNTEVALVGGALSRVGFVSARNVGRAALREAIDLYTPEVDGTLGSREAFVRCMLRLDGLLSVWAGLNYWNELKGCTVVRGGPLGTMLSVLEDVLDGEVRKVEATVREHRELLLTDTFAQRFAFDSIVFPASTSAAA